MSALAPRRLAPWSEKFASPSTYEPGHVAHQVVVDPEPAHRVVDRGVDPHRHAVRVLAGDALVHLEEVAVALLDHVVAEALRSPRRSRGTRRSSAGRRRARRRPRA